VNGRLQSEKDHLSGVFEAGTKEVPTRAILLLKIVTLGLALMANRAAVTSHDLDVIRRVAFSSIPFSRRSVLRALIDAGGEVSSTALESILGYSKPTVFCPYEGSGSDGDRVLSGGQCRGVKTSSPDAIESWRWLLAAFPRSTPTP
jgi:hypothetical protein